MTERKRQKIGLALSGGSVRGAAHIGVLEVLEQEGIRFDCLAGTSVGALVGALYCGGVEISHLRKMAKDLSWIKLVRPVRPRLGLLSSKGLEKIMIESMGDRRFDELEIPFAAVATDIVTEELVILREGRVVSAVQASCAVPGLFTPLEVDGRVLVDGGLLNNLPISVAREMGADYVIAVDLLPKIRGRQHRPKNFFDVFLISIYTVMSYNRDEAGQADCLIRPVIGDFSWADLSKAETLIQRGREAAEVAVEKIKSDLGFNLEDVASSVKTCGP